MRSLAAARLVAVRQPGRAAARHLEEAGADLLWPERRILSRVSDPRDKADASGLQKAVTLAKARASIGGFKFEKG